MQRRQLLLRGEEEQRSVAVLRELQPMVRDRLREECQRRPAEVKEMVRAVRQEERLLLEMEEERRAAVLRLRVARRRMLAMEERKDLLLKQRTERR